MDHKQYLDDHHLRRVDRSSDSNCRQHGQKEKTRQIRRVQLRQLQMLSDVRLLS